MDGTFFTLVAIGLAAGAVGALLGVGGGIILVPALTLMAGQPLRAAVGTSLVCICATSAAASLVYLRRDVVDLPIAVKLQFFNVVGAVAAGLAAGLIPAQPLFFAFAALLLVIGVQMWPRPAAPAPVADRPPRPGTAVGACVGAGVVSGLLGVGGGVLNTPILHLLLRLPFDRAVASSAYMVGITAAAGALIYLARGDVHPGVAAGTMLGVLAGSLPAATFGHRVDQRWLKMAFALLLAYAAIQMVRRGLAA